MGCGNTLFLGSGGHVTCSWSRCPEPTAAGLILDEPETEHIVTFSDLGGFSIRHPLRDRVELDDLGDCNLHLYLASLSGPPVKPGRYRASRPERGGDWGFEELG